MLFYFWFREFFFFLSMISYVLWVWESLLIRTPTGLLGSFAQSRRGCLSWRRTRHRKGRQCLVTAFEPRSSPARPSDSRRRIATVWPELGVLKLKFSWICFEKSIIVKAARFIYFYFHKLYALKLKEQEKRQSVISFSIFYKPIVSILCSRYSFKYLNILVYFYMMSYFKFYCWIAGCLLRYSIILNWELLEYFP